LVAVNDFVSELRCELAAIRAAGLHRELRRIESRAGERIRWQGRELVNFSSNDYLGLASHPAVIEAAARAARDWGGGAGASRLICGSLAVHHELEEALARFKGVEAALTFSSGHAAALGGIPALVGHGDVVILDKLAHACLVDGARLSGARLRVYAHNDLDELRDLLRWADNRQRTDAASADRRARTLIVTESVFSMDGDRAPLRQLVDLQDQFGAWLWLDEAHAVGLYGERRRGLAEAEGVAGRIEVQMGTLGKALGSAGGYLCGSRELVDLLINRARSFIFSTAPTPAAAAAAQAALTVLESPSGVELTGQLWRRVAKVRDLAAAAGWPLPPSAGAILPLKVGDEQKCVECAARLRAAGVFIPAIRFPAVPRGTARLRLTVAAHPHDDDLETLSRALAAVGPQRLGT
jgi:8-amino-7-oxononanoate synthase